MKLKIENLLPFSFFDIIIPLMFLSFIYKTNNNTPVKIDIQGHRGARGLYPENTVTAFIEAVKLGVTTIEMDVIVSKDSQPVSSAFH